MATVGAFFGVGDPWRRPLPSRWWRRDIAIAVGFLVVGAVGLELERSLGSLSQIAAPEVVQHLPLVLAGVLIVWRRRFPVATVAAITVLWLVTGILLPPLAVSLVLQFLFLAVFYAAIAWGAPRGRTVAVVLLCVAALMVWVTVDLVHRTSNGASSPGPFPCSCADRLHLPDQRDLLRRRDPGWSAGLAQRPAAGRAGRPGGADRATGRRVA
ncbi:hypothetical protein [Branchiibius cervicis]|uniref:Sensor histidine kinase n=1 Tax=Branchiibius cervicis TaxID=908252 RepID=A0ABW2APD2_9MICO